ncbi:hypothetical protein M3Y99_01618700 [Aphelenchoides fujianensis]|nr:hypothetical protein M3Y99_01618700 [Aphelenchoides fujianensis]
MRPTTSKSTLFDTPPALRASGSRQWDDSNSQNSRWDPPARFFLFVRCVKKVIDKPSSEQRPRRVCVEVMDKWASHGHRRRPRSGEIAVRLPTSTSCTALCGRKAASCPEHSVDDPCAHGSNRPISCGRANERSASEAVRPGRPCGRRGVQENPRVLNCANSKLVATRYNSCSLSVITTD